MGCLYVLRVRLIKLLKCGPRIGFIIVFSIAFVSNYVIKNLLIEGENDNSICLSAKLSVVTEEIIFNAVIR